MDLIQQLNQEQLEKLSAGKTIPEFGPGDTIIVNVKVKEGERTRVQAYEGVCIGRSGGGINESFTVRKISYGEGVERVFPIYSPNIDSIKLVRRGKVRRAKLYYSAWSARQVGAHRREAGQSSGCCCSRVIAENSGMQKARLCRAFFVGSSVPRYFDDSGPFMIQR